MIVTENYSGVQIDDLIGMAQRENNNKRKNLIVNYLQGKHIPVSASKSLKLFELLAQRIRISGQGITMVIGFAETATAIGAAVAAHIGGECIYIHTSREKISHELCIADFSEEHSHASEQFLFSSDGADILSGIKHIIFAEDELTTGKTILNIIDILKNIAEPDCRFYAASIINGMNHENYNEYRLREIELFWLVRLDDSITDMNREMNIARLDDIQPSYRTRRVHRITANGMVDPRLGCRIENYLDACECLCDEIICYLGKLFTNVSTVDVIGTEEFMFPAIKLAYELEKDGFTVTSHSTTRSPIVPSESEGYPISSRCRLHSLYDHDRTTYLYNLYECDAVILLTDADDPGNNAADEISEVLKTSEILIVTWRK